MLWREIYYGGVNQPPSCHFTAIWLVRPNVVRLRVEQHSTLRRSDCGSPRTECCEITHLHYNTSYCRRARAAKWRSAFKVTIQERSSKGYDTTLSTLPFDSHFLYSHLLQPVTPIHNRILNDDLSKQYLTLCWQKWVISKIARCLWLISVLHVVFTKEKRWRFEIDGSELVHFVFQWPITQYCNLICTIRCWPYKKDKVFIVILSWLPLFWIFHAIYSFNTQLYLKTLNMFN